MWREVLRDLPDFQIELVDVAADTVVVKVVFLGMGRASGAAHAPPSTPSRRALTPVASHNRAIVQAEAWVGCARRSAQQRRTRRSSRHFGHWQSRLAVPPGSVTRVPGSAAGALTLTRMRRRE